MQGTLGAGGFRRRLIVAVVLASQLAPLGWVADERPARASEGITPNILLILIDDGRDEMLRYLPNVRRLLVGQGVRFTNGYVVNPVCCPSRASILTGDYSHTTGVYTNHSSEHGGFAAFRDGSTIATWLQDAGYRTGLWGKYFNGYGREAYVPPGWDRWFATFGRGAYYDYRAVVDGDELSFGHGPADYGTTVLRRDAITFIRETPSTQPVFLYFAPHAPHKPAIPQPRDRDAFASERPWRPPSFNERDVS
ncbi:MAG TPA: sulfatase-like hydrolase/transferase, partial [Actinomycetota bacterium]|nr:sulfatase-like hydrolase/transferase [Actinomycetota bacterium]